MKYFIQKLVDGQDLTFEEAKSAMTVIMDGKATEAQIASFITAMRMKRETVEELAACATVLRDKCERLSVSGDVLDIVGTGGDGSNTFNISTASSFVVAACGVKVAKHGNRSVSSQCGSADVLEALGVKLDVTPEASKDILERTNMCFMFAPLYHKSMKHAAKPRKELAIRSLFNLLGPLANPAYASHQLLGVYDEALITPMAEVLKAIGIKRALVVCGKGVDEVSLMGETKVCEVNEGTINYFTIHPEAFGLKTCRLEDLQGKDAKFNAEVIRGILSGEVIGPKKDVIVLNGGVALYVALKDRRLEACMAMAQDAIESGRANKKLEDFVAATNQ